RGVTRLQKLCLELETRLVSHFFCGFEQLLTSVELRLHHRIEWEIPAHLDNVDADHLSLRRLCDPGHQTNDIGVRAAPRERHEDALCLHECASLAAREV